MAAILVEHLSKAYASGTRALVDVNLDVAEGEFVAIVGPSGCGKSTLLRILAGLDDATDGRVTLTASGSPIPDATASFDKLRMTEAKLRMTEPVSPPGAVDSSPPVTLSLSKGAVALPSAMVFQEAALFPWMRVEENVAFAFDSLDVPAADVRRRVAEQLELVGLQRFARAYPHQLSGGMKQRVAVARAFVVDPPLLFMDEPFGALDEQTRVGLVGELMRLWERTSKTVLFVTHGIEEAITLADRVVVLSSSPGTVKAIVPIDLPRPRDAIEIRGDAHFASLAVRIWELLR